MSIQFVSKLVVQLGKTGERVFLLIFILEKQKTKRNFVRKVWKFTRYSWSATDSNL